VEPLEDISRNYCKEFGPPDKSQTPTNAFYAWVVANASFRIMLADGGSKQNRKHCADALNDDPRTWLQTFSQFFLLDRYW